MVEKVDIQQPEIELPSEDNDWAIMARIHNQWVRLVSPQLGLDASKMVLGDVLDKIISDDGNIFVRFQYGWGDELSEVARQSKADLQERLDWEISISELPEDIKDSLKEVKNQATLLRWERKEERESLYNLWKQARAQISSRSETDQALLEARNYYFDKSRLLTDYYKDFLRKR